ncbi:MAG: hypothetical protein C4567_02815 [Deltaproteobacteria bacterium]|nr:MAG: hypothetical protein C4567_02815 [Deltaproteobacteria bacterium]
MAIQDNPPEVRGLLEVLGLLEEPLGVHYTELEPREGFSPQAYRLPTAEMEAKGEVDLEETFANFSCVIGHLWKARKKETAAYFDQARFGCLGAAFFLGYLKPQLETIVHYVSTGIPNILEGECYLESPAVTRLFYETLDPRPAPAPFCVFKPLSQFAPDETPEVVIFFARAESISGLNQLATYVTNDFEAVQSPFGAGCANVLTWPLKYLERGQLKAVLGGWDPSDRKFLKPDEITFAVPQEMFRRMTTRWQESFLTKQAWASVRKKIELSRKKWGE